ncbi:cytoplasmic dynein 2 heavy chain 1-like protein [Labeo rohita]|uniref:Cytoplasmic dynein 2 heavy chain 1-like protein n=2 Tax=Labeo rohita TaxID=84645 RepID=A0A498M5B3_LABRO|nr:cytoplasmic dynein 2 heavy chain 1-like protein [Labeo rohita]
MEAQSAQTDKRRDSSHLTPTKSNALKKLRPHDEDITNATLLQAITSLTARFDSQNEKLEEMANQMRRNSVMVAEISKAVEFNAAEIKDCKEKCLETSKSLLGLTSSHKDLASRTSELERYKRRWNLRINGMKEKPEEDPRREVIVLFAEIAPHLVQKLDDIVDTVHRIGKKEPGKPRQMIVEFAMRKYRDEFWQSTKNSSVCRDRGVRFAEDLTKEDRLARAALWPLIDQARKAGKKAYFRGPFGYIEGKRIDST